MILTNTIIHTTGHPAGTFFPDKACQDCNREDYALEWWNRFPEPAKDTFERGADAKGL